MKYSLKKIALFAEIVGGIAIIISLIFVGVQFKENTIATRSATANSANAMAVNWYAATGTDQQSSQLLWDYIKNPKDLTNGEIYQATILMHGLFLSFQNSFYLAEEGTLDQDVQESLMASVIAVKNQIGFNHYWENRKSLFFVEFRDYITAVLESDSEVTEGIYINLKVEDNEVPVDESLDQ